MTKHQWEKLSLEEKIVVARAAFDAALGNVKRASEKLGVARSTLSTFITQERVLFGERLLAKFNYFFCSHCGHRNHVQRFVPDEESSGALGDNPAS